MSFLAVKDFAHFQHYRDRNPPWIKLYGTVLTDAKFLLLPEAAQAQLMKLWILASQLGNPLPDNRKLLAGRIGCTGRFYIREIIDSGFLIPCEESDSAVLADPLAKSEQNDRPSVRGRNQRSEVEVVGEDRAREEVLGEPSLTALYVTIWANQAITARWGEQPAPLTQGSAVDLADTLRTQGIEWQVVRASIYQQCKESKQDRPPRSPNYFRRGIAEAWERELARRASERAGDQTPNQVDGAAVSRSTRANRAATMFAKILEMAEENGGSKFIRKTRVAELGVDVLRAYESVGGAEKFLSTPKDKRSFLLRDFTDLLNGISDDTAA